MDSLMNAYERFSSVFGTETEEYGEIQDYETEAEAEAVANRMGGTGTHEHVREDGLVTYMPFSTHLEYEMKAEQLNTQEEAPSFRDNLKDKLQYRLNQLIDSTYTNNSL